MLSQTPSPYRTRRNRESDLGWNRECNRLHRRDVGRGVKKQHGRGKGVSCGISAEFWLSRVGSTRPTFVIHDS